MAPLTAPDRDFFRLVSRAAFVNPFSREREELDRAIAGWVGEGPPEAVLARAVRTVGERVAALEEKGPLRPGAFGAEDGPLVEAAVLFDAFHRHVADLDGLIRDQLAGGETPCAVPFARDALGLLTRRGIAAPEARRTFAFFYQLRRAFYFIDRSLVGRCASMGELRRHLWNDVFTADTGWYGRRLWDRMEDFSTLLLGETGTGKGSAAAAIGRSGFIPFDERMGCFSESFARNFIALNLSQFPESLIESELFGHRKGAFTGAVDHHQGVFARCTPHGAIFLDEVGDVSVPVQIKLLQVLQERTFSPVGSHERLRFRGRVIAATNRPLDGLRRDGRFRDDLYYRLCSDVVVVPPLRRRLAEDPRELGLLVAHLAARALGGEEPEIAAAVEEALARDLLPAYPWPGNVRELEQAVRRVLLTGSYRGEAGAATDDLRARLLEGIDGGTLDARELLQGYCALLHGRWGTYEEVARRTGLDRRTVKKHVLAAAGGRGEDGE
ncbi:MAG: sigma 54-interacting transcriptional regulator [Thermodesulfobacteriota bacterium]